MDFLDNFFDDELNNNEKKSSEYYEMSDKDIPVSFDKTEVKPKEEQTIQVTEVCKISDNYGDADKNRNFIVDNLFSELVSDYQRSKARFNLGISEAYSLIWGNIKGEISNQSDLHNYIVAEIQAKLDNLDVTEDIDNLWTMVLSVLDQKANKLSPKLEGEPTTTLPNPDDDSDRIASTKWINNKLLDSGDYNLKYIYLDEDHMFYGDSPKTITLSWDYYQTPTRQSIDGNPLNNYTRQFVFTNVDDSKIIHFSYDLDGKTYNRFINFNKIYAYYVNDTDNIDGATLFKDFPIIVNSLENKFVYLYIPNDENAHIYVDNLLGGFIKYGDGDYMMVKDVPYSIYRSVNSNLGKLHINYELE